MPWIADEWWDTGPISNMTVDENVPRNTGLVDHKGRPIYKEPNEIGFGRKHNIYSVKG